MYIDIDIPNMHARTHARIYIDIDFPNMNLIIYLYDQQWIAHTNTKAHNI